MKTGWTKGIVILLCAWGLPQAVFPSGAQAASAAVGVGATTARFSVTPYVQHPATNAMSIIFFATEPCSATVTCGPQTQTVTCVEAPAIQNGTSRRYRGRVRFEGLKPLTDYRYEVALGDGGPGTGRPTYSNTFRTLPGKDTPVRFIGYCDCETKSGTDMADEWDYTKNGKDYHGNYYVSRSVGFASNIVHMVARKPDLITVSGDLVAEGRNQTCWDEYWKENAGGLGLGYNDPAGSIPILAAIGNHDLKDGSTLDKAEGGKNQYEKFFTYFEFNTNGVHYDVSDGTSEPETRDTSMLFHRTDLGPVTLIFLDTNKGATGYGPESTQDYADRPAMRSPDFRPGSLQYDWLTNQLADAQLNSRFTFVINHHCPYSVGQHNRPSNGGGYTSYNTGSGYDGESAQAVRCLTETMIRYGVDGWLCGHDEIVEHSQLSGEEIRPDGSARAHTLNVYDLGSGGDGLRGRSLVENPYEVFRAFKDAPAVWSGDTLVSGGSHYGFMEVDVTTNKNGKWTCSLTPCHDFVNQVNGKAAGFRLLRYRDRIIIDGESDKIVYQERLGDAFPADYVEYVRPGETGPGLEVPAGPDSFAVTPYLQRPASDAMTLVFFTKAASVSRVTCRRHDGAGATFAETTTGVWAQALTNNLVCGDGSRANEKLYRHRVRFKGLEPNRIYDYTVTLAGGTSYSNTFRTASDRRTPIRFVAYADCETTADPFANYVKNLAQMKAREPDFIAIAGDLVARGGIQSNWDGFWRANAGDRGEIAGSVPLLTVLGNHDLYDNGVANDKADDYKYDLQGETGTERYLAYFENEPNGVEYTVRDGTEIPETRDLSQLFHRVDYGPVTLIFLDTNNGDDNDPSKDTNYETRSDGTHCPPGIDRKRGGRHPDFNPGSPQYDWLTNQLADAQANSRFTFVLNHHCPYSIGSHNKGPTETGGSAQPVRVLTETMVRYGVDGWICGHDEILEHSITNGWEILPDGSKRKHTLSIYDLGCSGDTFRTSNECQNPLEYFKVTSSNYGFLEVDVNTNKSGCWTCSLRPVDVSGGSYKAQKDQIILEEESGDVVYKEHGNETRPADWLEYVKPPEGLAWDESVDVEMTEVSAADLTYNGAEQKPRLTVRAGELIVPTDHYTVTTSPAPVRDAREYSVTVTGTGNVRGSKTAVFKVNRAPATVKAKNISMVVGTVPEPRLEVEVTGTFGTDAVTCTELSREDGNDVGTYAITVTGEAVQGNYDVTFVNGWFTIKEDVVFVDGEDAEIAVDGEIAVDVGETAIKVGKVTVRGSGDLTIANCQNLTANSVDLSGLDGTVTYEYVSSSANKSLPSNLKSAITGQSDQKVKYAFRGTSAANGWDFGGTWSGSAGKALIPTHLIMEEGTHAWTVEVSSDNTSTYFGANGTDANPTLLIGDGATLNFTVHDLSGYKGTMNAGGVIRVNAGGRLNVLALTSGSYHNFNYRQRLVLDPGSETVFDYSSSYLFVIHGGSDIGGDVTRAQIYVPAGDGTAGPAVLRRRSSGGAGLCINGNSASRGGGCAIYVGAGSKLLLDSTVKIGESDSGSGDRTLAKYGAGELEITGEVTKDVAFKAYAGIVTLPASSGAFNGGLTAAADVTYRFPAGWENDTAYALGSGTVNGTAPAADEATVYVGEKTLTGVTLAYSGKTVRYVKPPEPQPIASVTVVADLAYNGAVQTPLAVVTAQDGTTVPSAAYCVSTEPESVRPAGDYTLKVTGTTPLYFGEATTQFTVNRAQATVKADDVSKEFGAEDPAFTATVTGTYGDDTLEYDFTREDGADYGRYDITPIGDPVQGNYTVTYEKGTLAITKAMPKPEGTLTAEITYGTKLSGATVAGKMKHGGDEVEGTFTFVELNRGPSVADSGTEYAAVFTPSNTDNYASAEVKVKVTVAKRMLTVHAANVSVAYGTETPAYGYVLSGFVSGESAANVTIRGDPTYASGYSSALQPGECDVSVATTGTLEADNYSFTVDSTAARLTVTRRTVTVTSLDAEMTYGAEEPEFAARIDNAVAGEEDRIAYGFTREPGDDVRTGGYLITPTGATEQGNYIVRFVADGRLTIIPAKITSAIAPSQEYANATLTPVVTVYAGERVVPSDGYSIGTWKWSRSEQTAGSGNTALKTVGINTATVTGKGNFEGTATVTFEVTKANYDMSGVIFADQTVVYDGTAHSLAYAGTLPKGVRSESTVSNPVYSGNGKTDVGEYIVTVSFTSGDANHYNPVPPMTAKLTIGPAPLTVTADDQGVGAGEDPPPFTVSYSGFVNGEDAGKLSGTLGFTCAYDPAEATMGQTFEILPGGLTADNYAITFKPGTLTVGKSTPRLKSLTADEITYGETLASSTLRGEAQDAMENPVTGTFAWADDSIAPTVAESGTAYDVTFTPDDAEKYTVAHFHATVAVNPAELTVAVSNATAVYGAAAPKFGCEITGFIEGEDESVVSGARRLTCPYKPFDSAGTYAITPDLSTFEADNYTFKSAPGTLTVDKAPLTVSAKDLTATYWDAPPAYAVTYSGFLGRDTASVVSGTADLWCAYQQGDKIGQYDIVVSNVFGLSAVNYDFIAAEAPGKLTVNRKSVTVAANNQSKPYGANDPPLTATVTGEVGGQSVLYNDPVVDYRGASPLEASVGRYAITVSGAADQGNYAVAYKSGTMEVTRASLVGENLAATIEYGQRLGEAVVGGEVRASSGGKTVEGSFAFVNPDQRPSVVASGAYDAVFKPKDSRSYAEATLSVQVTVARKALTVKAVDEEIVYGDVPPAEHACTITGFIDGEDESVVSGTCGYACTYAQFGDVGKYPIEVDHSGLSAANYVFAAAETPGQLTVSPKSATVTAKDASKVYGEGDPPFKAEVAGTLNGDSLTNGFARAAGEDVREGGYEIRPTGDAVQGNYAVTYVPATLTIDPASVTEATAAPQTFTGNRLNPVVTVKAGDLMLQSGDYTVSNWSGDLRDAGTYTATVTGTGNFTGTAEVTFEVTEADYDMNGVTFEDDVVTYDGQAHALAIGGELPAGVTVEYDVGGETEAGEYRVTAKFTGDSNHKAIGDRTATLTINKAKLTSATAELQTYDGSKKTPVLKVMAGELECTTYDLGEWSGNLTDAGTYTATVRGAGDFAGEIEVSFTIRGEVIVTIPVRDGLAERVYANGAELQPVGESGDGVAYEVPVGAKVVVEFAADGSSGVRITGGVQRYEIDGIGGDISFGGEDGEYGLPETMDVAADDYKFVPGVPLTAEDVFGTELAARVADPDLSWTVSGLPAGLKFNSKTRAVTGAPTAALKTYVTKLVRKEKSTAVETVVVTNATKAFPIVHVAVAPGFDGTGKVSGENAKTAANKTITLKATADKRDAAATATKAATVKSAFAGWYLDEACTRPSAGDWRNPSYAYTVTPAPETTLYAKFVRASDPSATNLAVEVVSYEYAKGEDFLVVPAGTGIAPIRIYVDSPVKFTVTAKNLPGGLKLVQDKATGGYSIEGKATKPGELEKPVTLTVKNAANAKGVTKEFRIRVDNFRDAAAFPDVLDRYDLFVAGVPNVVTIAALTNGAVASVSGLPSGLKFDKKTAAISGTAAKPGKFLVTLRKTLKEPNGKGRQTSVTHVATTLFVVYQGNGLPDPASRGGEIRDGIVITPSLGSRPGWAGEKLDFHVGVPQKFTLAVEGLAGVDTTVTAKGLPSGLKFVKKKDKATGITSYTIEGVPKTASPVDGKTGAVKLSHVVLSGSNKYKWTGSAAFDIEVQALPAWAQGTYDGAVSATGVETGTATLTVSAKGAVSGTIREIVAGKERKLTLKASSLASYDQARDVFTLLPTGKDGTEPVTRAFELSASAADPRLGRVESDGILLLQNPWKNAGTKAEFADAFKPSETLSSDGLTLTVKANGAVAIAGKVIGADGEKAVSLSGSAQAIWNPEAGSYEVVVYVAPKTNFGGLCRIVKLSVGPD